MSTGESRALVVGYGRMGKIHARALRDLGYQVSTVDPNGDATWTTVPECVSDDEWDAVCIAVPIEHVASEAARWAGFAGHLLIEKPFAASLSEAQWLRDMLKAQRVAVGYVERFNPRAVALREALDALVFDGIHPTRAMFTRWNGRPSHSAALDLRSHDIDLARHLGIPLDVCTFDTMADTPWKLRMVEVELDNGLTLHADLMAHDASPVHDQWRAFLSGGEGVATVTDAVEVLASLERATISEVAA